MLHIFWRHWNGLFWPIEAMPAQTASLYLINCLLFSLQQHCFKVVKANSLSVTAPEKMCGCPIIFWRMASLLDFYHLGLNKSCLVWHDVTAIHIMSELSNTLCVIAVKWSQFCFSIIMVLLSNWNQYLGQDADYLGNLTSVTRRKKPKILNFRINERPRQLCW